jgi:hypothetical protein
MTELRHGDRVRCIDAGHSGHLVKDVEYIVDTIDGDYVVLQELPGEGMGWLPNRFELIERATLQTDRAVDWKPGDTVRCVKADYNYGNLELGKHYIIDRICNDGNIKLVSDLFRGGWLADRFELVERAMSPDVTPVRTIMRKEIVPGFYDGVRVTTYVTGKTTIEYATLASPDGLRAAARIFNEIADALEQKP